MAERITPKLKEAFGEWLRKRGIKVILFDLDDTLLQTHIVFKEQKEAYWKFCQNTASHIDPQKIIDDFGKLEEEFYQTMGVSEKRWQYIIERLSALHGVEIWKEGVDILERVYKLCPPVSDGAFDILKVCKDLEMKLGLVTHASQSWTDIKLKSSGLGNFFEQTFVIDVEKHRLKEAKHWRKAINSFGVDPTLVMAIGDNLKGDIKGASKAGVKTLVWIPSPWHIYNDGQLPNGVFQISSIGNLVTDLLIK